MIKDHSIIYYYFLLSVFFVSNVIIGNNEDAVLGNKYYNNLDPIELPYVLEKPINPKEYKVGPGDQFLLHMIYPSGIINTKISISPLGDLLIPQVGIVDLNNMYLDSAIDAIKDKCVKKYKNADINLTLSKIKQFKRLLCSIKKS